MSSMQSTKHGCTLSTTFLNLSNASSMISSPIFHPDRPLVILAGWLGCQPSKLRRYASLYKRYGFENIIATIATPQMVISSSRSKQETQEYTEWPRLDTNITTMNEMAWRILHQVHTSRCSIFVFHGFSNGGGGLWEQIRNILSLTTTSTDSPELRKDLFALKEKLAGVVFDSSPCYYSPLDHDTLSEALSYCSFFERAKYYASEIVNFATFYHARTRQQQQERAMEYWQNMRNDPWDVRQLYLFSSDDNLTPHEPLMELIQHRQSIFEKDRILFRQWDSSPHCCHLLRHPVEYEQALSVFLELCMTDGTETRPSVILSRL